MQAIFERKPDFQFSDFAVEDTAIVPEPVFCDLLEHPLAERDFIAGHGQQMRMDADGVRHCLLVMGEGRSDGLLVDSEGSGYVRYAAYVPKAISIRYPSLSKANQMLSAAVDYIIADGTSQTTDSHWSTSIGKVSEQTGRDVDEDAYLREILGDMLLERPEVADLEIEDDFEVTYHPEYCPYCMNQAGEAPDTFIQK